MSDNRRQDARVKQWLTSRRSGLSSPVASGYEQQWSTRRWRYERRASLQVVPSWPCVQLDAGTTFPGDGIDLPDIAFGAQTTPAYSENAAGTGGTLTVSDGRHAASIALLGNYIARSFAAAADATAVLWSRKRNCSNSRC
jgi:hypothetical protein